MLFVIVLAGFIASLIAAIIAERKADFEIKAGEVVAISSATVFGVTLLVMVFILAFNYIGADGEKAANEVRYESLMTQYENKYYENDNDVGKKELVKEIQEWNEDLAKNKKMQRNFWVGIFYPNIYDDYKMITLEHEE